MTKITIGAGIAPGAYEVTLQKVVGPKTISVLGEDVDIYEWTFVTDEGEELRDSTSTATGPRSKMFGWITALNSGRAPESGDDLDLDDFGGHRAIATVSLNDRGWPKIASLSAIPVATQQRRFAEATGAPTRPTAAPAKRPTPPVRPAPVEIAERQSNDIPF